MKLTTFADNLAGSPVSALLFAELDRQAALILRDHSSGQNARNWATQQLSGQLGNRVALAVFLTNPTIAATVDAGNTPSDSDIEYVVVAEVLPVIIPAELPQGG